MYPDVSKELSEAHCKAMASLAIRIDSDAKRIHVGQNETISCEFSWVCTVVGEATASDCAVINFECRIVMRRVLIF